MHHGNKAYFDKIKALKRLRTITRLLKNNEITEEEAVDMIEQDDSFYRVEKVEVLPLFNKGFNVYPSTGTATTWDGTYYGIATYGSSIITYTLTT